jgi:hypothetical protein
MSDEKLIEYLKSRDLVRDMDSRAFRSNVLDELHGFKRRMFAIHFTVVIVGVYVTLDIGNKWFGWW